MKRRYFSTLLVLALAGAGPVFGQTIKDEFVAQLHQQGFKKLSITRTWLGRTRITGSNGKFKRELIFNSTSGEILRDYWKDIAPKSKKKDAELLKPEDLPNPDAGRDSGSSDNAGGDNGSGQGGDGSGGDGSGGDGAGSGEGHGGDGHGG